MVGLQHETHPAIRDHYRRLALGRSADKRRRNDHFGHLTRYMCEGLSQPYPHGPFELCYNPQDLGLSDARHRELLTSLSHLGPPPVDNLLNPKWILNGTGQYDYVAANPLYKIKDFERASVAQNIHSSVIHGANVVHLCDGDGHSAALDMLAIGGEAKAVYLNDSDSELWSIASNEICKTAGYPLENIHPLNGNIFDPTFWNHKIWNKLKRDTAPTVVFLMGATFNNFTPIQMQDLLLTFRKKFKPGTVFYIGIDGTMDKETLNKIYGPRFSQWYMSGCARGMWSINLEPDMTRATCANEYGGNKKLFTTLTPVVSFSRPQEFIINIPREGQRGSDPIPLVISKIRGDTIHKTSDFFIECLCAYTNVMASPRVYPIFFEEPVRLPYENDNYPGVRAGVWQLKLVA